MALAEARRYLRLPLKLDRVDAEAFDELLRKTYEGGSGESDAARACEDDDRSGAPGAGAARAGRPARKRRRRADHPADQRAADAGDPRERLRHPHRAVRESPGGALPRRRRAARGAAVQARASRRWWSRASRSCRSSTSPRSACRRTAASACASPAARSTCASRPSRPATASAWCCDCSTSRPGRLDLDSLGMDDRHAAADRRADPQAARHPAGHRPDRLGQDHDAVCGARAAQRQHPATS